MERTFLKRLSFKITFSSVLCETYPCPVRFTASKYEISKEKFNTKDKALNQIDAHFYERYPKWTTSEFQKCCQVWRGICRQGNIDCTNGILILAWHFVKQIAWLFMPKVTKFISFIFHPLANWKCIEWLKQFLVSIFGCVVTTWDKILSSLEPVSAIVWVCYHLV